MPFKKAQHLCLPVGILSLQGPRDDFITFRLIRETDIGLLSVESNSTLPVSSHAARVEYTSPDEQPGSQMQISKVIFRYGSAGHLPVEDIQPQNRTLPLVDLDASQPQPRLSRTLLVAVRIGSKQVRDKPNERQSKRGKQLVQLVLDVLLLRQGALPSTAPFAMNQERGRARYKNERIQQAKGKPLVLVRNDGGKEGGENRQGGDAELEPLNDLEPGRGIARETEANRHVRNDIYL